MDEITVKVHEISADGLPDMDTLTGRVAFIFDGCIVSGWPLVEAGNQDVLWEGNSDVARPGGFYGVTHWVEFPEPLWQIGKPQKAHVILFKPSGKYYTQEEWRIPTEVPDYSEHRGDYTRPPIGPYDMLHSPDFRRIGGGAVLVESQEPWGYPHLFPGGGETDE